MLGDIVFRVKSPAIVGWYESWEEALEKGLYQALKLIK